MTSIATELMTSSTLLSFLMVFPDIKSDRYSLHLSLPYSTRVTSMEATVSPRFVKTCERSKDFPKRTANVANYSESSSPVKFKNRIAYSFDSDCKNLQHIENSFYVSSVTNYSKKAAVEKVREKTDCYSSQKQKRQYFKIGGPDKFYKTYQSQGRGNWDMYE